MTALSVNVNKIAVLRNSRGGAEPSVLKAAETAIKAGAHGITVHPRPDQRHITPGDVDALAKLCRKHGVEYNIEGNPFAPAHGEYPGLMALIERTRPTQATLVPDDDGQITSDHGFDLRYSAAALIHLKALEAQKRFTRLHRHTHYTEPVGRLRKRGRSWLSPRP